MNVKRIRVWLPSLSLIFTLCLLTGCSLDNTTTSTQQTPTASAVNVNGFGTAANHVHSLLAFPNHVLVLATHYGLFRSEDDGATWIKVAAGNDQLMQGLMTYSLGSRPLHSQRMYVLQQVALHHNSA